MEGKGIKPIEFSDYPGIYETLAEWARYTMRSNRIWPRARDVHTFRPGPAGGKVTVAMRNSKKTPKDSTEFEREQLRFFLTKSNAATMLAGVNPSLAWLPMLAELKLIDAETQLAPWIQKNFAEADAIREVAANIHFFGRDTADILEIRLNRTGEASHY